MGMHRRCGVAALISKNAAKFEERSGNCWRGFCELWSMSIQNAMDFLLIHVECPESRDTLYKLNCFDDFRNWQIDHNNSFNWDEFDESINLLHVKCQTHEQAERLMHNVDWAKMFFQSLTNP